MESHFLHLVLGIIRSCLTAHKHNGGCIHIITGGSMPPHPLCLWWRNPCTSPPKTTRKMWSLMIGSRVMKINPWKTLSLRTQTCLTGWFKCERMNNQKYWHHQFTSRPGVMIQELDESEYQISNKEITSSDGTYLSDNDTMRSPIRH